MPEHTYHEYHCVNCGAPLTPDDVVYDISGIAFFGALPGDYTQEGAWHAGLSTPPEAAVVTDFVSRIVSSEYIARLLDAS